MLYNIKSLLEDLNLTEEEKEDLIKEIHDEFLEDEMLFELHLYRFIKYFNQKKSKQ